MHPDVPAQDAIFVMVRRDLMRPDHTFLHLRWPCQLTLGVRNIVLTTFHAELAHELQPA